MQPLPLPVEVTQAEGHMTRFLLGTHRTHCLLVTVALVASGCFATGSIETFVPAQKNRDAADVAASEWDAQARLVAVHGIESNQTSDDPPHLTGRSDPLVGDGRAHAWKYVFASQDRPDDGYHVTVAANGTVLDANVTEPGDDVEPIVDWNVDSDEAARTVADENQTYRDATGRNDTTVVFFLGMGETDGDETDPVWLLLVEEDNGSDVLFVGVNARNGSYLGAVSPGAFPFRVFPTSVPEESGTFESDVTVANPQNTHTFELQHNGHESLSVSLRIGATAPGVELNMTVEGPAGTTGATTWTASAGSTGETAIGFGQPAAGQWTVTVRLDEGVAQDYAVAWCAPGFGPSSPFAPSGC